MQIYADASIHHRNIGLVLLYCTQRVCANLNSRQIKSDKKLIHFKSNSGWIEFKTIKILKCPCTAVRNLRSGARFGDNICPRLVIGLLKTIPVVTIENLDLRKVIEPIWQHRLLKITRYNQRSTTTVPGLSIGCHIVLSSQEVESNGLIDRWI